ncbi:MAG: MotA/TolQ/ExbB proton channel family protein [Clostridia bacterium]|nr:MotA/TolQ/ExbB proton channel family protein [Clostridia bacterium]
MKRKPDIMSIIGIILAFGLIVFGIMCTRDAETEKYVFVPEAIKHFFDLPSIIITLGGVIATLMFMFPASQFAKIPKHLLIVFSPKVYKPEVYIAKIVECAKKARANGLLALEEDTNEMTDNFMKNSFQMVVDSVDQEKVKEQMDCWLANLDDRHNADRAFYDKGAEMGPAFGMIGTLIGLVNMLQNMSDMDALGPNMAVALITAFYGSLVANALFVPISNKLRVRHEEEYLCMSIIAEGVQAIQAGENPKLVQERLIHMLPEYKQKKFMPAEGGSDDGESGGKKGK